MLRFAFIPRIRALAAMDKGLSTLGPTRGYKTHKKIFLVFIKITSWWRELSLMWAPPVDIGTIKSHRPLRGGGGMTREISTVRSPLVSLPATQGTVDLTTDGDPLISGHSVINGSKSDPLKQRAPKHGPRGPDRFDIPTTARTPRTRAIRGGGCELPVLPFIHLSIPAR